MPRLFGDNYGRARAGALLRVAGLVVGFGLTTGGVWLIVTSTTAKDERIGALLGIWGVLLGAWALYATRHHDEVTQSGSAVAVRPNGGGLDTLNDAAALRAYELRLQEMLRREIHQTLGAELAALRSDLAALRSEVVEKVGGELRLERIETTRIIGSDIEALQREVRQLKSGRYGEDLAASFGGTRAFTRDTVEAEVVEMPAPARRAAAPAPAPAPAETAAPTKPAEPAESAEPATARLPHVEPPAVEPVIPAAAAPSPVDWIFDAQPATRVPAPPVAAPAPPPEPAPAPARAPEPAPASPPAAPERRPAPEPAAAENVPMQPGAPEPVAPAPSGSGDPFAALPRIRPFTEFELDPIEPAPPSPSPSAAAARHATDAAGAEAPRSGGRRRREDADGEDVLSRILERERQSG